MNAPSDKPSKWRRYWKETVRVLRITKRPSKSEFLNLTKITGLGCLVIGVIGFVIFLLKQLLL